MKIRIALLGVVVLATAVYAQDKVSQRRLERGFVTFDNDKDTMLDAMEFKALGEHSPKLKGKVQTIEHLFRLLDTNDDSQLDRQEYLQISSVDITSLVVADPPLHLGMKHSNSETDLDAAQQAFFESKIRPVLVNRCYRCHSEHSEVLGGNLALDTREGIRRGGNSGPGLIVGDRDKSLIIEAIRYTNTDLQMPPEEEGGKLPDTVIADFENWVSMGAPDPRDGKAIERRPEWDVEKAKNHWSFQSLTTPAVPQVKAADWPKTDIDRFVLAGLETHELRPVGDASAEILLRRLTFDLIGMPPTREEMHAFLEAYAYDADQSVAAAVDRLLSSPHFGERWGRHWLDVARYAESTGRDVNLLLPHAWRYRDYVIESFNQDKPINMFFEEQIAGDLLPADNDRDRAIKQIATGFLAIGTRSLNERNATQFALDTADEQIDTMSQAMLGLTVSCARCHDHKFDPISQSDYYGLAGIFLSTETCYGTLPTFQNLHHGSVIELPESSGLPRLPNRLSAQQRSELEKELTKMERYAAIQFYGTAIKGKLTGQGFDINNDPQKLVMFVGINAKIGELRTQLNTYAADGTQKRLAIGVRDYPTAVKVPLPENPKSLTAAFEKFSGRPNQFRKIVDSPLYLRGDVDKPAARVPRGLPSMLDRDSISIPSTESGRRELAAWIVSSRNPLTARVFVNRVWHWLFGSGIVSSVDNFGTTGQLPANQALLDHLATRFQQHQWSLKTLLKEIVMSRSYQLSSNFDAKNFEIDPENTFVWRMSPRRLDAECIRDAMLAISGDLDLQPPVGSLVAELGDASIGGYPIKTLKAPLSDQLFLSVNKKYRSVYLPLPRNAVPESLTVFDFSEPTTVAGRRDVTTVPSQALFMLNNALVDSCAQRLGERLQQVEPALRIDAAFQLAYTRLPTSGERKIVQEFFANLPTRDDENAAWTSFSRALLASAEFRSLD